MSNKILVLFAHPAFHKSRVNKKMIESITSIDDIRIHNLYDTYPDFHINVKVEQNLLVEHDIIIWHHPFYWYSAPAILKEWIDLVLAHGFAYGRTGQALQGKKVLTAITSGGREEAYQEGGYNNFTINQLLAPFEQTARLCKMVYLPPFVVHGTHLLEADALKTNADNYKKILVSLRDDLFSEEEIMNHNYINDILN